MNKTAGFLVTFLGIILFSAKAILAKMCYAVAPIDTITILTLRMGFSLPIFVIVGLWKSEKNMEPIVGKNFWYLIFLGCVGYYGASYFDFEGLQTVDASLERLIIFSYPTFVTLISLLVFKSKISMNQWLAIIGTYFGIAIVFLPALVYDDFEYDKLGVIFIFLSSITYASYLVASQHFIPKIGTIRFTTWAMVISCLAVITHYCFSHKMEIFQLPTQLYVYGFIMSVFCTVLPSYCISAGIKMLSSSTVGVIGSVGPVATILLSYLILGEQITVYHILGGFVIVVSVLYLSLKKS